MYFNTPKGKWSSRIYDFSREWVKLGNEVHVITANYYKSDLTSNKLYEQFNIDGINVHFINISIDNKKSYHKRIFDFILFTIISFFISIKLKGGIYIYSSGPLNVFINALVNRILLKRKYLVEIRDLWPEVLKEIKVIQQGWIYSLLLRFVKFIYINSEGIIVLSEGMKDYIVMNYHIKESAIHVATNSADLDRIAKYQSESISIKEKYLIYFGNLGDINCTKDVLDIFVSYKSKFQSDLILVMIGNGPLENLVKNYSETYDFIIFMNSLEKSELIPWIKNAVFSILPLRPGEIINTSSPNKFFESVACGTPVFQSTTGWIQKLILTEGLGYTFNIANKEEAVTKLHYILECDTNILESNCIKFAKENFNKEKIAKSYLKFIHESSLLKTLD